MEAHDTYHTRPTIKTENRGVTVYWKITLSPGRGEYLHMSFGEKQQEGRREKSGKCEFKNREAQGNVDIEV
jgi:hypothetical protein